MEWGYGDLLDLIFEHYVADYKGSNIGYYDNDDFDVYWAIDGRLKAASMGYLQLGLLVSIIGVLRSQTRVSRLVPAVGVVYFGWEVMGAFESWLIVFYK